MDLARIIVSVVIALLVLVTGGGKVMDLQFSRANREALGISPTFWRVTGSLEVLAFAGLLVGIWWVPAGIAAAAGIVCLMIGAIAFRIRTHDTKVVRGSVADVILALIAVAIIVLGVLVLSA